MQLVRTTIRLEKPLKIAAEKKALERDTTFQAIISEALSLYLEKMNESKAKKLVFIDGDLGVPLDNLSREDIYAD